MRNSQAPTDLIALAPDSVLCITEHLQPTDIISLRRTCKILYNLTKLRMVWINVMRSIMNRQSTSEAIFPIQTMPLPLLEYVALAPHRLLSLLEKFDGASLRPMTIRVLPSRLTNAEKEKHGIVDNNGLYNTYVEASGRFLASLSAYESFTLLTVWDLGLCGNDVIKPLARYLEQAPLTLYLDGFGPASPGSNVFYLISTHESSFLLPLSIWVHEVSLSNPSKISFLAKLEIPVDPFIVPHITQVQDTCRLVVQYDDDGGSKCFWIWDFQDNAAAVLIAADCPSTGKETTHCYQDCIMIASEGIVRIYNIPPLIPCNSLIVPIERKAAIIVTAPSQAPDAFFIAPEFSPNMPPYILNITTTRLTFFEVVDSNESHNPKLPNKLPIAVGSVDVADLAFRSRDHRLGMALQKCDDHLLLQGYSNVEPDSGDVLVFTANVGRICRGLEVTQLIKTTLSNPLSRQDIKTSQFCPLLGRLCIHTLPHVAHFRTAHCVYILDYLGPPE